jgi:hypothetical protein
MQKKRIPPQRWSAGSMLESGVADGYGERMALIHINRNRENLGTFTDQEVADGLASGRFLPGDLAWREPMSSWEPLSTFTDLPEPSQAAPAPTLAPGAPEELPVEVEPAWERGDSSVSTAIQTVRQVFTEPGRTFAKMPVSGGFKKPLLFYVLVSWVSGVVAAGYQLIISFINPAMVWGEAAGDMSPAFLVGMTIGMVILMPLFLAGGAFLSAGMVHVALMATGGASKTFEATFRAIAYANGSVSVLQFIPICGGWLFPFASLAYSVIALRETHRTDWWRVIVAYLLIFLLCCGIVVGLVVLAGIFGAALAAAGLGGE